MRKKVVEFRPRNPEFDITPPKPASLYIPEWYKDTKPVKESILTAKRCVPLIDSLSAGYMVVLAADVHWRAESEKKYWSSSKVQLISSHHQIQTDQFELSDEFETQPYKWINQFHIKTPKGYSMLFTHPINRTDLPFYSFTGLVDTDRHPLIVNFPFVIKKGFSGVIPAGTPIAQCIPVKRDNWESTIKDPNKRHNHVDEFNVTTPPFGWYKRKYWVKKLYQ